jgi:hypothetical protein
MRWGVGAQLAHRDVDAKQFDTWTLQPPDDVGHDYLFELGLESARLFMQQEREQAQTSGTGRERAGTASTTVP